jgi:hypothetical protein
MLNPLQAASSFACDGCGHHASFHNLRNPGEEPDLEFEELSSSPRNIKSINGGLIKNGRKRNATIAGRITAGGDEEDMEGRGDEDVQMVKRSRN